VQGRERSNIRRGKFITQNTQLSYQAATDKGKFIPIPCWKGPYGLEIEAAKVSRQLAHEGDKAVSPTYRPSLPHRR
jgi:hypothetical protein